MAWEGWYEYGGVEIINVARTEAYAEHASVGWFRSVYKNEALPLILGEDYTSPLQDDAPWLDPDRNDSANFYGCYPLEITGIEDSTMTAPITENTGDGGVIGRVRRATRPVVFNLALIGADECAVEYGFGWLKNAIAGGPCRADSVQSCAEGNNLCFLSCPPGIDMFGTQAPPQTNDTLTLLRANLSTNPSMEVSAAGWSAAAGLAAPTRILANAAHGSARLSAMGNNTSTTPRLAQGVGPLAPGDVLSMSARVRAEDVLNLVKNGSMDANVTGWTAAGTKLSTYATGRTNKGGLIGWGTGHVANAEGITQVVAGLTVGKSYKLSAWLKNFDAAGAKSKPLIRIGGLINGNAVTTVGVWTQSKLTFTATATSHTVAIVNSGVTAKGYTVVDDILLYAAENVPTSALFRVTTDNGTTIIADVATPWAPDSTGYQTVSGTITVPAGASGIQFQPGLVTPGNYTGQMGLDQVLIEKADAVGAYFDGDSGDTALYVNQWSGPPGLSVSQQFSVTTVSVTDTPPPPFDPTDCLSGLLRSLHQVTATVGPVVTAKRTTTNGGCVWLVTLTLTAGNPIVFGDERPLIIGFGDPKVAVPYVGGVIPDGGGFDLNGFIETEVACPVPTFQPIYDPLCPAVIPPPPLPSIALSCFDFPVNYKRRQFSIPAQNVPLWSKVVPYFEIHTPTTEVRSLRLRFYADVDGDGSVTQDPCAFCGDIVFSYIPAGATLVFDGADHLVYVRQANGLRQRADALVFGSDGRPFEWPELTCGFGYIVTLDLPQTGALPVVDMSLYARAV